MVLALFGVAVALVSPLALAQGKIENAAKALQKKAMEEDYLSTDFNKAVDKLQKAIAQCGDSSCSAALRARLRRDLGVVQIGGAIDKEKGIESFVEAIKIDSAVTLDPDVRTKDLDAAFAEARKRAGGGGSDKPDKPSGVPGQPQGDFDHTPTAEQTVRTPIPVYAEYSGDEQLVRVIARYKGFGMTDWKTVELKKMGDKGWGGLLPCADVQQGITQYYLQGFNSNNDPVATGGDRSSPYKVPVRAEKVAEPPHLPNASPPAQCQDTGDCPPNFPGCKKAPVGATPSASSEPTGKESGEFCEEDAECKSNRCVSAKCTDYAGASKAPKVWIGVAGALDYTFIPTSDDVCRLKPDATPINEQNYYCMLGGTDYPSRDPTKGAENEAIIPSSERGSDKVSGGGALGNIRLMVTADYAVTPNVLIGGRLGLVFNSYPGEEAAKDGKRFSAPIHLELRATYVIGSDPLAKKGFAPYVFAGGGIGQFETMVPVQVIDRTKGKIDVDAWHLAGPAFLTLGGGGRYAVSSRFAFTFGLRGNLAFINAFAPSIGPEIGGQVGF